MNIAYFQYVLLSRVSSIIETFSANHFSIVLQKKIFEKVLEFEIAGFVIMLVADPWLEVGCFAPFDVVGKKGNGLEALFVIFLGIVVNQIEADNVGVADGLLEVGEDGFGLLDESKLFLENG